MDPLRNLVTITPSRPAAGHNRVEGRPPSGAGAGWRVHPRRSETGGLPSEKEKKKSEALQNSWNELLERRKASSPPMAAGDFQDGPVRDVRSASAYCAPTVRYSARTPPGHGKRLRKTRRRSTATHPRKLGGSCTIADLCNNASSEYFRPGNRVNGQRRASRGGVHQTHSRRPAPRGLLFEVAVAAVAAAEAPAADPPSADCPTLRRNAMIVL